MIEKSEYATKYVFRERGVTTMIMSRFGTKIAAIMIGHYPSTIKLDPLLLYKRSNIR